MRARLSSRCPKQAARGPISDRALSRAVEAGVASRRLVAWAVLVLLASFAAGTGWAALAPEIRVLLVESSSPIEIRSAIAVHRVGLTRKGLELVIDGRSAGST